MNLKSFILDYGLPSAAVIGTGLLTFALTGGQEEFPPDNEEGIVSGESEQEDRDYHRDDYDLTDGRLDEYLSESERRNDEINQSLQQVNSKLLLLENKEPAWASELLELTRSLTAEVQELKSLQLTAKLHCSTCNVQIGERISVEESTFESVSDGDNSAPSTVAVKRQKKLRDWIKELHYAIYAFSCGNADTQLIANDDLYKQLSSTLEEDQQQLFNYKPCSDEKTISAGAASLIMYINNILKNPGVPRYRRISTNNSSYKSALASLAGHALVLEAVGFEKKGSHFEWEWHTLPPKPSTEDSLMSSTTAAVAVAASTAVASTAAAAESEQQQSDVVDSVLETNSGELSSTSSASVVPLDRNKKPKGSVRFASDDVSTSSDLGQLNAGIKEESNSSSHSTTGTAAPINDSAVTSLTSTSTKTLATTATVLDPINDTNMLGDSSFEPSKAPADAEIARLVMEECVAVLSQLRKGRKDFLLYLIEKIGCTTNKCVIATGDEAENEPTMPTDVIQQNSVVSQDSIE